MTLHQGVLVVAHGGDVISQQWDSPMAIWRGHTAARAATYLLWGNTPLESLTASIATRST